MSIKFTSVPSKTLSQSILSTAYSFVPSNITGWDGNDLTSADFGTQAFGAFMNSDRTLLELFEWDPSTIANSSVTILYRGLKFDGTQTTEITANKLNWPAFDTIVMLGADIPQLMALVVEQSGDETIDGVKTFSSLPKSTAGNATTGTQLVTYAQALAMATGTASIDRLVLAGTAGETVAAGNILYLKAADNRWWKASSAASATSENVILGVAQGAGTAGNAITSGVLIKGLDSNQTALTANTLYYLSTGGGVSTSAGTKSVALGYTASTTSIFFNPNFNLQLTKDQQDAAAGNNTDIAVGSGNKYVTQTGLQHNAEKWVADASGSSTAYTATLSPAPTSQTDGMMVYVKIGLANTTTTPTLAVNGLTARTIVKTAGTALAVGDIAAGMYCIFQYDLTNTRWIMLNPVATAPITTIDVNIQQQVIVVKQPGSPSITYASTSYLGASASNPVFIVSNEGGTNAPQLSRYHKLGNGSLVMSHSVATTLQIGSYSSLCIIGSYVYVFGGVGGSPRLHRYDIADLTNETQMTISGTAMTNSTAIFSDGTNLYQMYTNGTAQIYTISGTTATSGGTVNYTSSITNYGYWSDGTYLYGIDAGSGSGVCYKWAIGGGSRTTGTTLFMEQYNLSGTQQTIGGGIFKEVGNTSQILTIFVNKTTNPVGKIIPITIF